MQTQETIDSFIIAALWCGDIEEARKQLEDDPSLESANLYTACVSGDVATVERFLHADPISAIAKGGPKNWEPILYVCFSGFLAGRLRFDGAFVAITRRLLSLGADPNSFFVGPQAWGSPKETALYGASGIANHVGLTELLLEAGADPCDGEREACGGETIYHTAEFSNLACMQLLFQYGVPQVAKDYCLLRQLDFENPEGTLLFLKNGANPNADLGKRKTALHHAILRGRSPKVVGLLLEYGAAIEGDGDDLSPFVWASRLGRREVADYLAEQGAKTELSTLDRFLTACSSADVATVRQLLKEMPDLVATLSDQDHMILTLAAREGSTEAVRVMLEAGFPLDFEEHGLQPLHWAAWMGHADTVAAILPYGPPLEARNSYGGTPLGAALYGWRHCTESNSVKGEARTASYRGVVEALIAAGAEIPDDRRVIDSLLAE